jgi:hypothetical protein
MLLRVVLAGEPVAETLSAGIGLFRAYSKNY